MTWQIQARNDTNQPLVPDTPASIGLHLPYLAGSVNVMININDRTANKVAAAIARSGNSVAGVAESTTIARSTLQRKLAGKSQFTIDDLYAIAQAIGVRTKALLPEEVLGEDVQLERAS